MMDQHATPGTLHDCIFEHDPAGKAGERWSCPDCSTRWLAEKGGWVIINY